MDFENSLTYEEGLEEIDALFEGEKHSDVPDLQLVRKGKAMLSEQVREQVREEED